MRGLSEKFGKVEGTLIVVEEGNDSYSFRNTGNYSDDGFNIGFVQIRKNFHKFLDINETPQTELNDQSYFSMRLNDKEIKKSNIVDTKVIEHDMFGVDMEQKLSLSKKYRPSWLLRSSSSSSTKETSISDENLDSNSEVELPSLVLMGCTHCHIYVMVAETNAKCPKCNSFVLLDVFRGNVEEI